jgi:hypothetical protein
MSKLLSVMATKILHDVELRETITKGIQSIMKDGKIDSTDIPDIMLIIMECTNNLEKFNLTYNQLVEVLEEVLLFILDEQNVIPDDKREDFYKMIRTTIKLVLLQPKLKSCLSGVWTKLKNLLCCGRTTTSNTNTSTNIENEVTHTVYARQVEEPEQVVVDEVVVGEPVNEPVNEPVDEHIVNEPVLNQQDNDQDNVQDNEQDNNEHIVNENVVNENIVDENIVDENVAN